MIIGKQIRTLLILGCVILLFSGCIQTTAGTPAGSSTTPAPTPTTEIPPTPLPTNTNPVRPRIILFIGDGMGAEHRLAGQYYTVGETRRLAMDSLPVRGWLHTDSYGGLLTDSSAAATALATGKKTYNDFVSLDINGAPLKTILEYAQERGMSVGLVSTKFITDATPSPFAAHLVGYGNRTEVASQYLEHRVDIIFGGGENDFLPIGVAGCSSASGRRADGRNLIQEAEDAGYTVVCDQHGFSALDPHTDTRVLGLFADDNMDRPFTPSLADMTRTAIEILSTNPNGYFLMVEGATIDIASHYNETQNVLDDVAGMDQAVAVGLEYAAQDENMLVIITADHETGGLSVDIAPNGAQNEDGPFFMPNGMEFFLRWSSSVHSYSAVPVTAVGPGAGALSGTHENTIVFDVMLAFLGIAIQGD